MAFTVRWWHLGIVIVLAAIVGMSIFGVLVWRAVSIETADQSEALRRFEAVHAEVGSARPVLDVGPDGTVIRREAPPTTPSSSRPASLNAIAYQVAERRLIEARVPFWFFRLKTPAAQYAFREVGLDFDRLGLTAADLERYGSRVILDQTAATGNRLLVWTE